MDRFAREDVRAVLRRFGMGSARRAPDSDDTEEVILLAESDYQKVDVDALTTALIDVLPHKKIWVTKDNPRWVGEPL